MQLVGVIGEVGPVFGVEALWDGVEALQAHDMIDAHVAGVAEGPGKHTPKVRIAILSCPLGVKRREAPVLTGFEEGVGGRTAAQPGHERAG